MVRENISRRFDPQDSFNFAHIAAALLAGPGLPFTRLLSAKR
jgi:hypothetical protein